VRVEEHTKYGASLAPRLAAAWALRRSSTFVLRGFVAFGASAKELLRLRSFDLRYRILGNKDLAPEKSWGVNAT